MVIFPGLQRPSALPAPSAELGTGKGGRDVPLYRPTRLFATPIRSVTIRPMAAKRMYIDQLMPGQTVDQVFLVRDKDLRTTKSGGLYIVCTLCDKTGTLPARMWQASEGIFNSIPVDGFLQIKGRTEDYKGSLQFIIDALRPYSAEKAPEVTETSLMALLLIFAVEMPESGSCCEKPST